MTAPEARAKANTKAAANEESDDRIERAEPKADAKTKIDKTTKAHHVIDKAGEGPDKDYEVDWIFAGRYRRKRIFQGWRDQALIEGKISGNKDQQHPPTTEEGARQLPAAAEGARGSAGSSDQAQAATEEGARQIPAAAEGARGSAGSSNEARRTLEFVVARSWKELVPRRSELIVA